MNYGIIHNRRPDKRTSADGAASNPLLNDPRMREMAKQMGLESKDFGSDAMNVWNMLNNMAESDPAAYQAFIAEQLKDGPPVQQQSPDGTATTTPSPPRSFNPKPGYVVKCTMMGSIKQQMVELKLFLNLCFYEIVDLPKNPNSNKDVPRDPHAVPTTSNLQIPLVIGSLRQIKDFNGSPCRAIDVVFHPWVFERCEWDLKFKRDILSLAISWVQQDAKITLTSSIGKFIKSQYKGGVLIGTEILTANFPINPDQQQTRTLDVKIRSEPGTNQDENELTELKTTPQQRQPSGSGAAPPKTTIAMSSPSDLLRKMTLNQENEAETSNSTSDFLIAPAVDGRKMNNQQQQLPKTKICADDVDKPAKKLIQVIEPKTKAAATTTTTTKKQSSAVKRGFLNSSKTPLYPKGSSEGKPSSAYVNLLSRCQVVDMTAMEQQKKQQQQQMMATQKERDAVASLLSPPPSLAPSSHEQQQTQEEEEMDHGDFEFEQLCMDADPDLVPANAAAAARNDPAHGNIFGDHLDEFAKFLSISPS